MALFLVLTGGVAYAANTIGSSEILDGQVKTAGLGANAVNSAKIADGQVTEADIGQAAVATPELKERRRHQPEGAQRDAGRQRHRHRGSEDRGGR